jgi:hypothetical protein
VATQTASPDAGWARSCFAGSDLLNVGCAALPDGSLLVAGNEWLNNRSVLLHFSAAGTLLGQRAYADVTFTGLAACTGGAVLTGARAWPDNFPFVARLNEVGGFSWMRQVRRACDVIGPLAAVQPDGSATLLYGFQPFESPTAPQEVVRLDAAGVVEWARQLGDTGQFRQPCIAADGAGNCFIGATNTQPRGVVLKLTADGQVAWRRTLGGSTDSSVWAIACDAAGNCFAGGGWATGGLLLKLAGNGELAWARQFDGDIYSRSQPEALASDGSGGVWTVQSNNSYYWQGYGHFDADGSLLFSRRQDWTYSSPFLLGLAVDDGALFLSGNTENDMGRGWEPSGTLAVGPLSAVLSLSTPGLTEIEAGAEEFNLVETAFAGTYDNGQPAGSNQCLLFAMRLEPVAD